MTEQDHKAYEFGPFRLDARKRLLLHEGVPVKLFPKELEMLLAFVQRPGVVLSKDELMQAIWGSSVVEEGTLTTNISHLRKILREKPDAHQYIVTIPGEGYGFVADVRTVDEAGGEAVAEMRWTRRYLMTGMVAGVLVLLGLYAWLTPPRAASPTPAAPAPIKSIAVLPFRPLVGADRDEVLEMGLTDTLITTLSQMRQVVVRPVTAVGRYAGLQQDAIAAGREQRVDAVLDGTIQQAGDAIRVTVRLIRVADGYQIWTQGFDERFTDIFRLQDSISRRVTQALAVPLTGGEKDLLAKRYTDNAAAYRLYILGRSQWSKYTPEASKKGIEYFERAIEQDPEYALAFAGVADAYHALARLDVMAPGEAFPKAKAAAMKALEIDETLAEAHTSLAGVLGDYDWDWAAAETHHKRAIDLKPNDPRTRHGYSTHLAMMSRFDEAIDQATRARDLDPLSPLAHTILGRALYQARRFDEAAAQLRTALELAPTFDFAHFLLGLIHLQKGDYSQAIPALRRSNSLGPVGYAYAVSGEKQRAVEILAEASRLSEKQYVPQIVPAVIHAGLGQNDRAFEFLEKAYQNREWHVRLLKVDPVFDRLRSDPRFGHLLARAGLSNGR